MNKHIVAFATCILLAAGCEQSTDDSGSTAFDSRYEPLPAQTTLITGATVLTGTGERLDNTDVLLVDMRSFARLGCCMFQRVSFPVMCLLTETGQVFQNNCKF